jgi:hypothetical protein
VDIQGTLYLWEPFDFGDIEDEDATLDKDDTVLDRIFNISSDDKTDHEETGIHGNNS